MPYSSLDDIPASLKGIKPPISLAQANKISEWADAMEQSDDPPDSPWAVAISQFRKLYRVEDGKWVKKQANNLLHNKASTADSRREKMQKRDYLVVPVIAQCHGVVNGEYVSDTELDRVAGGWNGRPVVINHPQDAAGNDISANAPCVLSQSQIGQLFNVRFEDDKLRGEAWIDVALAKAVQGGAEALRRFEQGKPTDVSTAYFRQLVEETGVFNGNAYVGKAVDLVPDHLAILLDEKGACSWSDGCGAPRTNADESLEAQLEDIRRAWYAEHERRNEPISEGPWITEVFEKYVIVEADGQYWRVSYAMEDGNPSFAARGEWQRVEQKRDWVPVKETELTENAVQRVVKAIIRALSPNKEATVNVEELIEAGAPFERAALEGMSEEQIAFLSRQAAPPAEPPATNDGETPDLAADLDALRAELATVKAELGVNKDRERKEAVARLAANKRCALTEEQMAGLDIATLRGIEQSLVDPDYRGSGGGRETGDGDEIVVLRSVPVLLKQKEA